eukprot:Opistho-2@57078
MATRSASHAGSWYEDSGSVLDSQLSQWLSKAAVKHAPARAIIAPHAGYSYSGPTAAHAYKQIDPTNIKRVFILGPSHHVYLSGCALTGMATYDTPLGPLVVDKEVNAELRAAGSFDTMSKSTDEDEHSIEMHLPYIKKVMERQPQFTIIPVLVGALKGDREAEYGAIFAKYLGDPKNLFVISSDFCHWGRRFDYTPTDQRFAKTHEFIEDLDRRGMSLIEQLDAKGFSDYLKAHKNTICGRHPISVLLQAITAYSNSASAAQPKLQFVAYAQSSAVTGPKDSSVSYASASMVL